MVITQNPPVAVQYQNLTAGTPFRLTLNGPILYKTTITPFGPGQLIDLASGDYIRDEPAPSAACYVVDGAFVEQL